MTDTCPTCSSPVRVVGGVTKHFEPSETDAAEMARLLEAMALPDRAVHVSWSPIAGEWRCSLVLIHETIGTTGPTPAEAVRVCWERSFEGK